MGSLTKTLLLVYFLFTNRKPNVFYQGFVIEKNILDIYFLDKWALIICMLQIKAL